MPVPQPTSLTPRSEAWVVPNRRESNDTRCLTEEANQTSQEKRTLLEIRSNKAADAWTTTRKRLH